MTNTALGSQIQTYGTNEAGSYHIYDGLWLSSSFTGYVDGSLMFTNSYVPTGPLNPTLSNDKPNNGDGNTICPIPIEEIYSQQL